MLGEGEDAPTASEMAPLEGTGRFVLHDRDQGSSKLLPRDENANPMTPSGP